MTGILVTTDKPEYNAGETVTATFPAPDVVHDETLTVAATYSGGAGQSTALLRATKVRPPSSIATDGSAEISAAFNAWFVSDEVPPGSTVDLRGLTLWGDKPFLVNSKPAIFLADGSTTIRKAKGVRPRPAKYTGEHWRLHPATEWSGGTVLGTNTVSDQSSKPEFGAYLADYAFEAAFRCDNPDGLRLHRGDYRPKGKVYIEAPEPDLVLDFGDGPTPEVVYI